MSSSYLSPLALESLYAYIPALLAVGVYIIRTGFEDRMLLDDLPGYHDYAAQVRSRLIPGIW